MRTLMVGICALGLAAGCNKPSQPTQERAVAQQAPAADCPHADKGAHEQACDPGKPIPPTKAQGHLGAPFQLAASEPLTAAIAQRKANAPVRVSGTVDAVCQKRGCWLVLRDGESKARVMVKKHAFSFPFGAKGSNAVIEGELRERSLSAAQVQHLKEDGDPSLKASGPKKEFFIFATAAQILPAAHP